MRLLSSSSSSSLLLRPSTWLVVLLTTRSALLPTAQGSLFSSSSLRLSSQAPLSAFPKYDMASEGGSGDGSMSKLATERIADTQQLFAGKPSLEVFKRSWQPDAIFEDPICYARGWRQFAAQWYAMPFFSKSITTAWRVTKDTPEEIQYVQKQLYGKFGFEKEMISTVVMKLGQDGRIKHFEDRWGHNPQPGLWAWLPRRLNALTMPLFISVPSSDHPDHSKKEL